jgi:excisionase family DNA binding protein
MPSEANDTPNLLSPGEVAELFRVDPKTVTRWAKAGKLSPVKTLGGHRRYHAHEVHELLRKIQVNFLHCPLCPLGQLGVLSN